MSTTKFTRRENWTKNTFCVGPVGPTDKENEVKMYKKYCFRYITSFKRQGSGSVSDWKAGSGFGSVSKWKARSGSVSKRSGFATLHSKPGPFDKQFCMANTAFFTLYTTFQSFNKEIFYSRLMWLYEILISTFRQDQNFNFVSYLFSSPTSAYAFPNSIYKVGNNHWKKLKYLLHYI
jgi:hypothetical protein